MYKVLEPIYQPVVDLQSRRVVYFEALARRIDGAEGGHGRLIELGESLGFIHLIDLGMLEQVLRVVAARPCLTVGINISVMTIEQAMGDLLSLFFRHVECAGRVIFEITETVKITNFQAVEKFVDAVRVADGRIAVDDLWDGFATFDLVRRIQPEFVKTSGGVVNDLLKSRNPRWLAMLRDQVSAWGGLVVAENIDSKDKLDLLQKAGIRFGQGYLLGRPRPLADGGRPECRLSNSPCAPGCVGEVETPKVA